MLAYTMSEGIGKYIELLEMTVICFMLRSVLDKHLAVQGEAQSSDSKSTF